MTAKIAPNTDNLILGKGVLYFDRKDAAGASTGELDLGNAPGFSLALSTTEKEHVTSREGIKQTDLTIPESEKWNGKFTLEEYSNENILLAIRGQDAVTYETQSASNTSITITAFRNRWIDLGKRYISNVVATHGATTFVEDTDYKLDKTIGRIYPMLNGAMYEGEQVLVTFNYAAVNLPQMKPSIRECRGFLRFVGNNEQGPNYEVKVWSVLLKCNSDIGFISDDWGKLEFTFSVDSDEENHPTNKYFLQTEIKASTVIS